MRHALSFLLFALALSGCLALVGHDGLWSCASDSDCNHGDICRQLTSGSFCASANYCESPQDCARGPNAATWEYGSGWTCVENGCAPPPCSTNSDCTPYLCASGSCTFECASDADCNPSFACNAGICSARTCTTDADCGYYQCASGVCLSSCYDDTSCGPTGVCAQNVCVAPTPCHEGSSGQCGGFACTNGGCPTSCANAGCDPGLVCNDQDACVCDTSAAACGKYICEGTACLTSCTTDSDCDPGLLCSPQGTCVTCTGTPSACEDLASCSAAGCYAGGSICTGGTFDCGIYSGDVVGCDNNLACTWDNSFSTCSGVGSCAGQPVGACAGVGSCAIGTSCYGTPTPCAELTYTQCAGTAGCSAN